MESPVSLRPVPPSGLPVSFNALQSFQGQGFGAPQAYFCLHRVHLTLHPEQFSSVLSPTHPTRLTHPALPIPSRVLPPPAWLHLQPVLTVCEAPHCLGNEVTAPQPNSPNSDSKLPF